jgi:hypothetical protein
VHLEGLCGSGTAIEELTSKAKIIPIARDAALPTPIPPDSNGPIVANWTKKSRLRPVKQQIRRFGNAQTVWVHGKFGGAHPVPSPGVPGEGVGAAEIVMHPNGAPMTFWV